MNKKQDALVPVFGALCFFLSAIEFVIPKPLPFLRIGLANVPLMLALDVLSFPAFLLLTVIKILGQAFISGTLFSYLILFSAAGTIGAALAMYALHKIPRKALSLAGISMAGAFVSNCVQLFIGRFFIFGEGIRYMAPPFLFIGAVTSLILGIFCESFESESEWYAHIRDADSPLYVQLPDDANPAPHPWIRLITGFTLLIALLFIQGLPAKAVMFAASFLLCLAEKQKIYWVPLCISTVGIVACHIFIPVGRELFSIGSFSLTSGALLNGLEKAVVLQAMIFISRWTLQVRIRIPGLLGIVLDESLYIFKQLLEYKDKIRPRHLITSIDELLLGLPFIISNPDAKRSSKLYIRGGKKRQV